MRLVIVGGSGSIGSQLANLAASRGATIVSLALTPSMDVEDSVTQITVDRTDRRAFAKVVSDVVSSSPRWDAVIDLIAMGADDAEQTLLSFENYVSHFIVLSTTLVYRRHPPAAFPITDSCLLAEPGQLGGYVDKKLELEAFWRSSACRSWTILRPYHIVGARTHIGCVPYHNRDPDLFTTLKCGRPLRLVRGGRSVLSFIHPFDLAEHILRLVRREATFRNCYNAVHPDPFLALEYYRKVASFLNRTLVIEEIEFAKIWDGDYGWELTALDHVYDASRLHRDTEYVPTHDLQCALTDAMRFRPAPEESGALPPVHQRMNRPPRPQPVELTQWLP